MKRLLIGAFFLLVIPMLLSGQATTQTDLVGVFSFQSFAPGGTADVTGTLDAFSDQTNQYFATNIQVGDVVWDNLGNRWEVMVINSANLLQANVDLRNINTVGGTPIGVGYVSRETSTLGLYLLVPDNNIGISQQLKSRIESHNMILLDQFLSQIDTTAGPPDGNGIYSGSDTIPTGTVAKVEDSFSITGDNDDVKLSFSRTATATAKSSIALSNATAIPLRITNADPADASNKAELILDFDANNTGIQTGSDIFMNAGGELKLSGSSVSLYQKYFFPDAFPSTTSGDTSLLAWTGDGSSATPLFLNKNVFGSGGAGDGNGIYQNVQADTIRNGGHYTRLPLNGSPWRIGTGDPSTDFYSNGEGSQLTTWEDNWIFNFRDTGSTQEIVSTLDWNPGFLDMYIEDEVNNHYVHSTMDGDYPRLVIAGYSANANNYIGFDLHFPGRKILHSTKAGASNLYYQTSLNGEAGTFSIGRVSNFSKYVPMSYRTLSVDLTSTTGNTISFYDSSYQFPNLIPSATSGDTSLMAWVGNGSGTTPLFLDKSLFGSRGVADGNGIYQNVLADTMRNGGHYTRLPLDGAYWKIGTGAYSDVMLASGSQLDIDDSSMYYISRDTTGGNDNKSTLYLEEGYLETYTEANDAYIFETFDVSAYHRHLGGWGAGGTSNRLDVDHKYDARQLLNSARSGSLHYQTRLDGSTGAFSIGRTGSNRLDAMAYSTIKADLTSTSGHTISFYNDSYSFANAIPGNAIGDTTLMAWVGNGSGTTPLFLNKNLFGGGGLTVSASNGLNDADPGGNVDVELGGALDKNTTVETDGFSLTLGDNIGDNRSTIRTSAGNLISLFAIDAAAANESGVDVLSTGTTISTDQGSPNDFASLAVNGQQVETIVSTASVVQTKFTQTTGGFNMVGIPAYADDAAAGADGLTTGDLYQTDGTGVSPLNVAGLLMIKQ